MTGNYNRVHFIGIGGSGMSGIAKILLNMGYDVTGSDLKVSEALTRLRDEGAKVFIGHDAKNVVGADLVVISSAIPKTNPEYMKADELNIPVVHRADMLSLLMSPKKGIAITGAHGKTTTTSMISLILEKNCFDPTVIIGGELNDIGGNATLGNGDYLVAEADESDGSFMKLNPLIGVVMNIENDHMDYYHNMDRMKKAFKKFVANIKDGGFAVFGSDNENVREIMKDTKKKSYTFGVKYPSDFMPKNIRMNGLVTHFDLFFREKNLGEMELHVPGLHNIINATAAAVVAHKLGIDMEGIASAIKTFRGVQRRFQIIDDIEGIKIIDDYAHHPTEIKATLNAARACKPRKIYAVFQPHRFSRTKLLAKDFASSFGDADEIIITDIFSAGEQPIEGISSKIIIDEIRKNGKQVSFVENKEDVYDFLSNMLLPGDFVLTIGAGDISDVAYDIADQLRNKGR